VIKKLTKDLKDKDKEIDRLRAAEQVVLSLSLSLPAPQQGGREPVAHGAHNTHCVRA
jgi:hypothetical protein